jgi:hypothetical protein
VRSALVVTGTIVMWALAVSAALIVVGAVASALWRGHYRTTIASVLFIAGGIIFIFNGVAGGSGRGRRADMIGAGTRAIVPTDSLGWVAVGLLVIGVGVIAAVL